MQLNIMGALGLLFIGLKLMGYIAWSWWLVLLPFWIGVPVVIVFLLIAGVVLASGKRR
jgi:hypothetical protein